MTRFAFSTLGCSGLEPGDAAAIAARHGFAGLELRAAPDEPVNVGMSPGRRRDAAAAVRRHGIVPLTVASYVRVANLAVPDGEVIDAAIEHGRLAADLGAPFLRVFPGGDVSDPARTRSEVDSATSDAAAARRLAAVVAGLRDTGVTVAVETHDSHPRGTDVRRIVDRCPQVRVIWDVLHTWRGGESPDDTARALHDRLAYVQVKDVASATDLAPLPPGDGVLPLAAVAEALRDRRYDGWVCWEYEQRWFPGSAPLSAVAGRVARWLQGWV